MTRTREPMLEAVARIRATYELGFTGTAVAALYSDLQDRVNRYAPNLGPAYTALIALADDCADVDAPAQVVDGVFDDLADLLRNA